MQCIYPLQIHNGAYFVQENSVQGRCAQEMGKMEWHVQSILPCRGRMEWKSIPFCPWRAIWHVGKNGMLRQPVKQPWLRLVHGWETIQWKAVIHGMPRVAKIQTEASVCSRNGCLLIPDKGLRMLPSKKKKRRSFWIRLIIPCYTRGTPSNTKHGLGTYNFNCMYLICKRIINMTIFYSDIIWKW